MFMDSEIPDTMNGFVIYNIDAETRSFQSAENFVEYLTSKAETANQKGMFKNEGDHHQSGSSTGGSLGGVGAVIGASIGAAVGGPAVAVGAGMLGKAIGDSVNGNKASVRFVYK